MFGQRAVCIDHREEFLVRLHRGDQRLGRHLQECAIERAGHRFGPFDQAFDLREVVGSDPRGAAGGRGRGLDFPDDAFPAFGRIDQHVRGTQRIDVVAGHSDPHLALVQEPVAATHPVTAQAENLRVRHLVAQQHHQPVHRPGECMRMRAPAHRPGDRHGGHGLQQDVRQQVRSRLARRHGAMHETLALRVGRAFQCTPLDAGLLGEPLQRARRVAVGVQRDVHVRPEHLAALLRLLQRDARQQHREPSRRVQRGRVTALDCHATTDQAVDHAIEQRPRQPRQRLHRQFVGTDLDQQRRHRTHAAAPFGSPAAPAISARRATYASATACDIFRTRRM